MQKILLLKSKKVLGFLSFIESIFFPIPTDVLLIPMAISKSYKWFDLALIATLMSVIGGVVGYLIGSYLFTDIYPLIVDYGYEDKFNISKSMFLSADEIFIASSSGGVTATTNSGPTTELLIREYENRKLTYGTEL